MVLTLALSIWWVIFNLRQIEMISALDVESASELLRYQRMLLYEGGVLVFLLLLGGIALLRMSYHERARRKQIQDFFSTFTHEIKTALASVRLQGESLQEDLENTPQAKLLSRLVSDTVRLELQLENSLFVARPEGEPLLEEKIPLRKLFSMIQYQWPALKVLLDLPEGIYLQGDLRAIEGVIKNLMSNAYTHGQAQTVRVVATLLPEKSRVKLEIEDDGRGFSGEWGELGQIYKRHSRTSGSGIGLYLVKKSVHQMGGEVEFLPASGGRGFLTRMELPGGQL